MHDSHMSDSTLPLADCLRSPEAAMAPDVRTSMVIGQATPSLAAHHAEIDAIRLSATVPESIAIQFETARNLYLYAWHVYRFYMVAKVQALTTLELGLRTCLPERLPEPYQWWPKQREPMLAGMLSYAIDQGLIKNEGFQRWHDATEQNARQRHSSETLKTMIDQRLEMMAYDEKAPVEITPEDQRWDLVAVLRESLPYQRNKLAHGSTALTSQVQGTIELVAEILGQLYPSPPRESQS
jgi:hypothetical protein